jgi:hypothetical protein
MLAILLHRQAKTIYLVLCPKGGFLGSFQRLSGQPRLILSFNALGRMLNSSANSRTIRSLPWYITLVLVRLFQFCCFNVAQRQFDGS